MIIRQDESGRNQGTEGGEAVVVRGMIELGKDDGEKEDDDECRHENCVLVSTADEVLDCSHGIAENAHVHRVREVELLLLCELYVSARVNLGPSLTIKFHSDCFLLMPCCLAVVLRCLRVIGRRPCKMWLSNGPSQSTHKMTNCPRFPRFETDFPVLLLFSEMPHFLSSLSAPWKQQTKHGKYTKSYNASAHLSSEPSVALPERHSTHIPNDPRAKVFAWGHPLPDQGA